MKLLLLALSLLMPAFADDASADVFVALDGKPVAAGNAIEADGHIRVVTTPVLRLFRTQSDTPQGTMLLFPGGGYNVLSAVNEGSLTAAMLNSAGYDVAMLEYPVNSGPQTRTFALASALKAWRLLKADPKALQLHGGKLSIMGYSAGGHLAARTAQQLKPAEQPDAVILIYPAYLDEKGTDGVPLVSPPTGKPGRLFTAIAANDRAEWVRSSRSFSDAWQAAGGAAAYHLLPDGGHGFGMRENRDGAAKTWPDLLVAFLAK